ncbi:MAG: Gldg family protein [Planctomycetota bacterium]|nr:Gldg family protein [Planctomycetota bacterium]
MFAPGGASFIGEEKLTEALLRVSSKDVSLIGFTNAHREIPFEDGSNGLGTLTDQIRSEAKEVEGLDPSQPIANRFDALVVAAPEIPYSKAALKNLDDYLYEGGGIVVFVPSVKQSKPFNDFVLNDWLRRMGVEVLEGIVQQDRQEGFFRDFSAAYSKFGSHPIVNPLGDRYIRSFFPKALREAEDKPDSVKYNRLVSSSNFAVRSWGEEEEQGTFDIAAALEGNVGDSTEQFRLVVVGDTRIPSDTYMGSDNANKDFVLNIINWLVGQEALIEIDEKSPEQFHFTFTNRKLKAIGLFVLLGLPLLCLYAAISVWLIRRK